VLLSTGEVAMVTHLPDDPALAEHPVVRILADALDQRTSEPDIVDLAEPGPDGSLRTIRRAVDSGTRSRGESPAP
jgi:hypothetical protein